MLAIQTDNIRSVLATTSEGRRLYNTHIVGDGQTQQNVLSELDECSRRYLSIAAAWSRAANKLSLREWTRSDTKGILLGNSIRNFEEIWPITRAVIRFLFYELMADSATKPCHTYMVLDEFARLGNVPQIVHVIQAALSLKLSLALGVHDVESVKDVYGEAAMGILGPCAFKAFLRNNSVETADWISRLIGNQDVLLEYESSSQSESRTKDSGSDAPTPSTVGTATTRNRQHVSRPAVPVESISQLPPADKDVGISGFFEGPMHPLYQGTLDGDVFSCEVDGRCQEECRTHDGFVPDSYFVWCPQHSQQDTMTPAEHFRPPDDTFTTLRGLGFEEDHTSHAHAFARDVIIPDTPVTDVENQEGDPVGPPRTSEPDSSTTQATSDSATPKKYNLADMHWDDELEMFVPNDDSE